VIEVSGVRVLVGEGRSRRAVLDDVTVRLEERRVGVVGANGSGKSTFARLLNGLTLPGTGSVRVDGLDTRSDGAEVRRRVGFCFTDPDAQIVMPTVREDVAFSLRRRGLTKDAVALAVDTALRDLGIAHLADSPAHALSGGEKQLLALCSVLVTEPSVLVLDEPTTLLDLRNAVRIGAIVDALPQQVLLVTHHLEMVESYDRVLVFDDGRLVHDGPPAESLDAYRRLMS